MKKWKTKDGKKIAVVDRFEDELKLRGVDYDQINNIWNNANIWTNILNQYLG